MIFDEQATFCQAIPSKVIILDGPSHNHICPERGIHI